MKNPIPDRFSLLRAESNMLCSNMPTKRRSCSALPLRTMQPMPRIGAVYPLREPVISLRERCRKIQPLNNLQETAVALVAASGATSMTTLDAAGRVEPALGLSAEPGVEAGVKMAALVGRCWAEM